MHIRKCHEDYKTTIKESVDHLKVKVSLQNQNEEAARQRQWGLQQHYMPLPKSSSDELLTLLPLQDQLHLLPAMIQISNQQQITVLKVAKQVVWQHVRTPN